MSRYARRVDGNQADIVRVLRARGASVEPLSRLGGGVPDLLVGFLGINLLFEVKDPEGARARGTGVPSATELTPAERDWQSAWIGQVCVINSAEEAMEYLDMIAAHSDPKFVERQREARDMQAGEEWKNG